MRGNFSNFANTTLQMGAPATGIGSSDTSFTVATGGGNNFPLVSTTTPYTPDYFVVAIDQELVLCSARSGDAFTVAQRGYEGTTAISHTNGAPVVLTVSGGEMTHIWQRLPDAYHPDVPPWYRGGANPSQWDDEFEEVAGNVATQGNWTFSPQDTGQTHSFGTNYLSHFDFHRATSSGGTYYLYQPITITGGFTITAKIHHGISIGQLGLYACSLFVSDSANPSTSVDGGYRAYAEYTNPYAMQASWPFASGPQTTRMRGVQGRYCAAGSTHYMQTYDGLPALHIYQGQQYLSISYDGSVSWGAWAGDGYTYTNLGYANNTFTPRSFGFRFWTSASDTISYDHCLIDWVRVINSSRFTWNNLLS